MNPPRETWGGAADHIDLKDVSVHSDLGELLATRSVDALSITPSTYLHPDATVKALEAGVLRLTLREERAMLRASLDLPPSERG